MKGGGENKGSDENKDWDDWDYESPTFSNVGTIQDLFEKKFPKSVKGNDGFADRYNLLWGQFIRTFRKLDSETQDFYASRIEEINSRILNALQWIQKEPTPSEYKSLKILLDRMNRTVMASEYSILEYMREAERRRASEKKDTDHAEPKQAQSSTSSGSRHLLTNQFDSTGTKSPEAEHPEAKSKESPEEPKEKAKKRSSKHQ